MRLRSLLQTTILVLVAAFVSCGALDRSEERVVVRIGDREITKKEFTRDMQIMANRMGIPGPEIKNVRRPLIRQTIDEYLILEFGRREGITVSDHELRSAILDIKRDYQGNVFKELMLRNYVDYEEWKEDFRHRILIERIVERASERMVPITFKEIKAYFEEHREDFRYPKKVKFRQVVVRTQEEAAGLLERLKHGETLAELSRGLSSGKDIEMGAEPGWFQKGQLEEALEGVIFSLPVGQTSQIVESPYGYHIIEVLEILPEGSKSLPEVMDDIESRLLEERRLAFHARWLEELRAAIPVEVDQEAVDALEFERIEGG